MRDRGRRQRRASARRSRRVRPRPPPAPAGTDRRPPPAGRDRRDPRPRQGSATPAPTPSADRPWLPLTATWRATDCSSPAARHSSKYKGSPARPVSPASPASLSYGNGKSPCVTLTHLVGDAADLADSNFSTPGPGAARSVCGRLRPNSSKPNQIQTKPDQENGFGLSWIPSSIRAFSMSYGQSKSKMHLPCPVGARPPVGILRRHLRADATPEAEALVEGETRGRLIAEKGRRICRKGPDVHTDQAVSIGQPPDSASRSAAPLTLLRR